MTFRVVMRFVLLFALLYSLLIAAWPIIGPTYANGFRAAGNFVLVILGQHERGSFFQTEHNDFRDTKLLLERRVTDGKVESTYTVSKIVGSRFGYDPTVMVIALILATPLPWRRLVRSLGLGVALVSAFVLLRLFIITVFALQTSSEGSFALWAVTPFTEKMVMVCLQLLVVGIGVEFLMPVFIWLMATIRGKDLNRFLVQGFRISSQYR